MDPSNHSRLHAIDPFRGYVCLGVVCLHLYGGALTPQLRGVFGGAGDFIFTYLRLGVESFFVLAGFFLAHMIRPSADNYVSVPRLLVRRLLRLAIPYWCAVAAVLVAAAVANAALGRRNTFPPGEVLSVVFFVQDVFGDRLALLYPLWSMATLFQFYVAALVVFWVARRAFLRVAPESYQGTTRRTMIGVGFLVLFLAPLAARPDEGNPLEWQLPRWASVLTLGAVAYWRGEGHVGRGAFAAAVAYHVALAAAFGNVWYGKAAVCAVLLLLMRRGVAIPDSRVTRALAAVGLRSYSIYLVHGFVGIRIVNWSVYMLPAYRNDGAVAVALVAAALAASLAAGFLFYRLVERPTAGFAARVRYRR
ncbi:MAG TPA: acyltransferase family protein [Gemmataceae bacterium]|nr:acyltransferase family protein [Gemmataceae bacterium]